MNGNAAARAAVSMTRPPPIRSIPTGSPVIQPCHARQVGRDKERPASLRGAVNVRVTVNRRPSPRATRSASS